MMNRLHAALVISIFSANAFAARDWQAGCGYEDCPIGSSWTGLIVWTVFLVAGLIGAAREGWRTFALAFVWLLVVGGTLYGWLIWNWHWLPFVIAVTAIWWGPSVRKSFRAKRDEIAP